MRVYECAYVMCVRTSACVWMCITVPIVLSRAHVCVHLCHSVHVDKCGESETQMSHPRYAIIINWLKHSYTRYCKICHMYLSCEI